MAENEMEKWAKIQARCAIAALVLAALGLPPSWYWAYSVYSAKSSGAQQMTTPAHFDFAFTVLIIFYAGAIAAGIGWAVLWLRSKAKKLLPMPKTQESSQPTRRLKIIEAHYGVEGISDPDVTHYLLERLHGNAYAELVGADLFHGFDPVSGKVKRLTVRYSFDGREAAVIRPENEWLILPEDMFLRKLLDACQEERRVNENQLKSDLWRAQEAYRQCKGELKKSTPSNDGEQSVAGLLNPLQVEALTIARDLRDFYAAFDPYPSDPVQRPGEDDHTFMVRHISEQRASRRRWEQKITHAYANRGFGPRITSFLHRFAEEFEDAPVGNADYAENLGNFPTDKTIPKLAQEMEMVAIWINRKQRNEVNLLGEPRVS